MLQSNAWYGDYVGLCLIHFFWESNERVSSWLYTKGHMKLMCIIFSLSNFCEVPGFNELTQMKIRMLKVAIMDSAILFGQIWLIICPTTIFVYNNTLSFVIYNFPMLGPPFMASSRSTPSKVYQEK